MILRLFNYMDTDFFFTQMKKSFRTQVEGDPPSAHHFLRQAKPLDLGLEQEGPIEDSYEEVMLTQEERDDGVSPFTKKVIKVTLRFLYQGDPHFFGLTPTKRDHDLNMLPMAEVDSGKLIVKLTLFSQKELGLNERDHQLIQENIKETVTRIKQYMEWVNDDIHAYCQELEQITKEVQQSFLSA